MTAKELVVDFLSNRAPRDMSARSIVDSARALGFSEQRIRMALTRLVEDRVAQSPSRGTYRLAPSGEAMRKEVRKWRNIASVTQAWSTLSPCAPAARAAMAMLAISFSMKAFCFCQTGPGRQGGRQPCQVAGPAQRAKRATTMFQSMLCMNASTYAAALAP